MLMRKRWSGQTTWHCRRCSYMVTPWQTIYCPLVSCIVWCSCSLCCIAYHDWSMAHNLLTTFQLYCVIILVTPSIADSGLFAGQLLVIWSFSNWWSRQSIWHCGRCGYILTPWQTICWPLQWLYTRYSMMQLLVMLYSISNSVTSKYGDSHLISKQHLIPVFFLPLYMLFCPLDSRCSLPSDLFAGQLLVIWSSSNWWSGQSIWHCGRCSYMVTPWQTIYCPLVSCIVWCSCLLCCIAYHDCSVAHNLLTTFQLYCVIILVTPSTADSELFAGQLLVIWSSSNWWSVQSIWHSRRCSYIVTPWETI